MTLLESKIKQLIDELSYSDERVVDTDRKSVEFIMKELAQWVVVNSDIL